MVGHARRICRVALQVMEVESLSWIDIHPPGLLPEDLLRIDISRLPTRPDPSTAEVDVLRVILALQPGGKQTHDVRTQEAAQTG